MYIENLIERIYVYIMKGEELMDDKFEKIENEELMSIEGGNTKIYSLLGEKLQLVWNSLFGDN